MYWIKLTELQSFVGNQRRTEYVNLSYINIMLQEVHICNVFEMFPGFNFGQQNCEKNDYQLNMAT